MKVHWKQVGKDPIATTWQAGLFQLGGDPVFRIVRVKDTWHVFPPTTSHGFAREPWSQCKREPVGYGSSHEQAEAIVESECRRWLNWMNDPTRAENIRRLMGWYADQGKQPPWA